MLLIGLIVVINSILTRHIDKKKFKYDKEQSKWNNYNWVYRNSLVYNWNMKDVRLFNLKKLLIGSWSNITKKENLASEKSFNLGCIPSSCPTAFYLYFCDWKGSQWTNGNRDDDYSFVKYRHVCIEAFRNSGQLSEYSK